ncbi:hypothetical protein M2323_001090 [Rhodoblastus acidophilus]|uniref:SOUL family heme-binding protein n=1 Tax=Rhodoblastus acidophilus TaxID=1074 RepID=UPI00222511D9|nr:heme-binding protein [Rhodoblastus acidophilus]MCW2283321.1 hypothetical protein [Rhodoblastus acidophilus]MCW2332181.1 hypothetical protein [Rhodoblastus acidophilus]
MFQAIPYYGVLAVESALNVIGVRLYEEPRYTVIDHVQDVEIRRYAPRAAAAVALVSGVDRNDAFRLLFDYIAGANAGRDRIAMTAPVELRGERLAMTAPVESSEGRMMFFLPADYGASAAPQPRDPRVQIVSVPSEKIAVLRFAGLGGVSPLRQKQLLSGLIRSRWRAVGEPFMYYYDAPFTLPFLRRNEAAVVVEERN